MVRRLVARDAASGDVPEHAVTSVVDACERTYAELGRWLGASGSHALFTRVLAQTRRGFPAIGSIDVRGGPEPRLEHVAEAVRAHGAAAVALALAAALVALLALLERLIGEDLAARLLERVITPYDPAAENASDDPDADASRGHETTR
jgi:hypothetical protein